MTRNKYVTTQVEEDTFRGIIDAANLWGDSISMATFKLVQRGLMSLDSELGSKTPLHIRVNRINQALSNKMSTKQRIGENYRLAKELGDEEALREIEEIAAELEIKL